MVEAYPLQWPVGWPRTKNPQRSAFKTSFRKARDGVLDQLRKLKAKDIVISTNIPVNRDNLPYANVREPKDSGVAIYFTLNKFQKCIPLDKWRTVADNLHAIELIINSLRGLDRWGQKEIIDATFGGFTALEDQSHSHFFSGFKTKVEAREKYRELAKKLHPDLGGNQEEFAQMQQEYENLP